MKNEILTGNRRYRVITRMFSAPLVVLQVEVYAPSTDDFPFAREYWRDATDEDLTTTKKPAV